jgi:hypothetical protein
MDSPFKKTRHKKRQGRCFELSSIYILEKGSANYTLVHGYRHCSILSYSNHHAWIEDEQTQTVYDLVENEVFTKDEYYQVNKIHHTKRYTPREAAQKIVDADGGCGPWDYLEEQLKWINKNKT